jgi:transcriptional regulator with XRE-family HTH domain
MASELKDKVAARLKKIIRGRAIVDIPGASKSYIYRMTKGQNITIDRLDSVLRAYGSSLAEFFEPWREDQRVDRQKLAVEIRQIVERILDDDDADLRQVRGFLLPFDPGERRPSNK